MKPVICLEPGPMQTRIFDGSRAYLKRLHARELAGGAYDRFLELGRTMEAGGLKIEVAAARIAKLLQKKRPPLRAVVSKNPWFDAFVPLLPQRWLDFFIHRLLNPTLKKPSLPAHD